MDSRKLYLNKLYSQMHLYLKSKKIKEYDLAYNELISFVDSINRADVENIKTVLPEKLVNKDESISEEEIKSIIEDIIKGNKEYKEFYSNYSSELKVKMDEEIIKRGFIGEYPKYYLKKEQELLILEFDEDIYLKEENISANRYCLILKVKNYEEIIPNFDIKDFSYTLLFTNYLEELQTGQIRTFMIHLPERDYLNPLTEELINQDIKYMEIIDCVLEGKKYLPKWYLNASKTEKAIYKEMFLFTLLITAFIGSFVNMFLFNGNLGSLIVIWIIIGIVDHFICKAISKKKYNEYHS